MSLSDFAGRYKGERAFVLGNGPSLAMAPFDLLEREYTFATNRIGLLFQTTSWRPTFYVLVTTAYSDRTFPRHELAETVRASQSAFVWDKYADHSDVAGLPNVYFVNCSHDGDYSGDMISDDFWSDDVTKQVCKWGTSTLASLQIAAWMGFDPIYLLGIDGYLGRHNEAEPDGNHFHPEYIPAWNGDVEVSNRAHRIAYQIALAASKRLGIRIYDATQSEGLEMFPRVDVYEVLEIEHAGG